MLRSPLIPTPIIVFFVVDVALGAAYLLNFSAGQPYRPLNRLVDLEGEANLPAWYASIQWFCVSVLLGVFALRNCSLGVVKSWPLGSTIVLWGSYELLHRYGFALRLDSVNTKAAAPLMRSPSVPDAELR